MPIGTPKVPVIRSEETVFLTLSELFEEERILFLCRNIEFTFMNELIALILLMDLEAESNIYIYINSHVGGVLSAMALYDTMQVSSSDVCTMNIGFVGSAASLILVGGAIPKRVAFPHARVLIHQPSTGFFSGTTEKMQVEAEEMFELRNTIAEIYGQNTGQPINVIQNDLERDTFMSAKEAQDYHIIDRIAVPKNWKI